MSGSVDELNSELPKSDILRVDSIRTATGPPALLVFKKIDVGKVGVEIVGKIDAAASDKIERTAFWLYDSSSQAIFGGKIDVESKTFENTWTFQVTFLPFFSLKMVFYFSEIKGPSPFFHPNIFLVKSYVGVKIKSRSLNF